MRDQGEIMAEEETKEQATQTGGQRKTRVGTVVSDKMQKTIVVAITRRFQHKKYKKYVRDQKHYKVHDEENTCRVGDRVLIEETRPISKQKRWRLKEIIERAPVV
jgi:small subunit ribosomal protein S17